MRDMGAGRGMIDHSEECDFCGFNTAELVRYESRPSLVEPGAPAIRWLCRVCAGTPAGNALTHPSQHPSRDVLRTIAYAANMILRGLKSESPQGRQVVGTLATDFKRRQVGGDE